MIVIDASAAASWVLPHEDGIDLNRLIEASNDFFAPFLFWAEIRNVILVSERRGLILPEAASRAMSAIERLDVIFDTSPSSNDVYNLSKNTALASMIVFILNLRIDNMLIFVPLIGRCVPQLSMRASF